MSSAAPEALVICSICRQAMVVSAFEEHLRQAHQLVTFRGVRRSFADTLEAMLEDLVSPHAGEAWQALVQLARREHPDRADSFLAGLLATTLARLPEARRETVIDNLAPIIAPGQAEVVGSLARHPEPAAHLLALAALGSLRFDPSLANTLRVLLLDRRLPPRKQVRLLAAMWPRLDDEVLAADLVGKLTIALGKAAAIKQLRRLEKLTGPHPAITARREELQQQAKLACPRCGVELRKPRMEQHLWREHRLILDGLRTRDPWQLVEEWLDACKEHSDPELLARCHVVAAKIDLDNGLTRLSRMLLVRGLADPAARRAILDEAREQNAACCPWCFALVGLPREVPPLSVNLRPGRLCARGYEVELDERGIQPRLEVRTPTQIIFQGLPPGRNLTYRGAAVLVSAPLVLIALLFALFWPVDANPIKPVAIVLLLAGGAFAAVRLAAGMKRPSPLPVLELTWRFLVPRLHEGDFDPTDSAFLAGLAQLHSRAGLAGVNLEALRRLMKLTEQAMLKGNGPPGHLAALSRLWVEKESTEGADPVPLVASLVARTFEGKLPLAFAQHLLAEWATSWWTAANLARLRILLCDRAFEAGFEVQNLLDAGENAPALGTVLGTIHARALAALRLLWSLRPTRPWDRLGEAWTAFELAGDPDRAEVLAGHTDLLLWYEDPSCQVVAESGRARMGPATIQFTTAGVWLQDVLFPIPPRVFEVRLKSVGCEMKLGNQVFRSPIDLDPLSRLLERWFRYAFHEFLPQYERVLSWQSPDRAALLRAWGAVPCPECGRHLLARAGEVGIALKEPS
jgi:hypothetical protein